MSKTIDTGTDHLLAEVTDGVGIITLNRPDARNALSTEMIDALGMVLAKFELDRAVKAVVVTGAGKGFCAGGDVKGFHAENQGQASEDAPTMDERIAAQRVWQHATAGKMYRMAKPVIAALPGAAAGAGMSLALAADFRIFSENAFITSAFGMISFSGDFGGTYFLSKLVPMNVAKKIYYFSQRHDAKECEKLGIADMVVPAEELQATALFMAKQLANGPTVATRYFKENITRAYDAGKMEDCLDLEVTHHWHTGLTEDHKNAVAAFVEKRAPEFKGR